MQELALTFLEAKNAWILHWGKQNCSIFQNVRSGKTIDFPSKYDLTEEDKKNIEMK